MFDLFADMVHHTREERNMEVLKFLLKLVDLKTLVCMFIVSGTVSYYFYNDLKEDVKEIKVDVKETNTALHELKNILISKKK